MDIWFTSDVHFHHKRILDFCPNTRRNCKTVEEMNQALTDMWNSLVAKGDIVYHLGDFSFGTEEETETTLKSLNGSKHFIMGNHDKPLLAARNRRLLADLKDYKEISHDGKKICMFHFPMWEWHQCHKGSYHLFGHVHETYSTVRGKSLNVGIDARPNKDMLLWHIDEIHQYMLDKPVITHHNKIKTEE